MSMNWVSSTFYDYGKSFYNEHETEFIHKSVKKDW